MQARMVRERSPSLRRKKSNKEVSRQISAPANIVAKYTFCIISCMYYAAKIQKTFFLLTKN